MKKNKWKTALIRLGILCGSIYIIYIFIQQQTVLNGYKKQEQYYLARIEEEKRKAEELEQLKAVYNTDEYIEKIAREKLGFVKQNEKIFIDASSR